MRTDDPGLPLSYFRQHGAGVAIDCGRCGRAKIVPLEATIDRLNARGIDGETVGIKALAEHLAGVCEGCGNRNLSTSPAWPARPGQDGLTRR